MAKVYAPDLVCVRRSQPYDRATLVVEPPLLLVPFRKLQPFLAPEDLDLLVVHAPALDPQQLGHLAVAVTTIALCQADHG